MDLQNTTLDDVSAVVGFSATLRLVAWFGAGGNVYVPDTATDGQLLVRLIGLSAATKLSTEWGHQHISLPKLSAYETDVRRRRVGRLYEAGMSFGEIAWHMRISERRAQQICQELQIAHLIHGGKTAAEKSLKKRPAKKLAKIGGKKPCKKALQKSPSKKPLKKAPPESAGTLPDAFFTRSRKTVDA